MKPNRNVARVLNCIHIDRVLFMAPLISHKNLGSASRSSRTGYSLVEILIVLSVASLLSVLVATGLQAVLGSAYSSEVSDLSDILVRARAHAMANNTYVFVGIQEVDASQPGSGVQVPGTGRVGVTVVASNDGTRIYSTAAPTALTPANSGRLTVVSPLRHFENMHITTTPVSGTLPNTSTGTSYNVASSSGTTKSTSLTTFTWPLAGTAQYSFGNNASSAGTVIQFSPQGEAQVVTGANSDSVLQWIEIDLVPTHAASTSTSSSKNAATILIDGSSGSVSTYRS
jgi:prepilin-type N-terminal cleavage/methylation domain-containing protein